MPYGGMQVISGKSQPLYRTRKGVTAIRGWSASKKVTREYDITTPLIHRVIAHRMGLRIKGLAIDHINGNPSDNRRSNLRVATSGQNRANSKAKSNSTSGYKGVNLKERSLSTQNKRRSDYLGKTWYAQINVDGKKLYLGRFKTAKEAAKAYDLAAIKHHGEFARTNFPIENYTT
jgi:hypothetical protein